MWSREDLVASLKSLGLLQDPRVERAFREVPQERFLPEELASLAYADMPLPVVSAPRSATMPSARCLVSAVGLLEATPGLRILLAGARGGFPVAVLAAITPPENIVVVERDESLRTVTAERLQANGLGDARVVPEPPSETFDRILVMDHRRTTLTELVPLLADPGTLISRGRGVHDLTFVKMVHRGGETAQFTFNEAPSRVAAGARGSEHMASVDFGRLFAVEDLLTHAWEEQITGHYDQHFQDVADETFSGGPLDGVSFDAAAEPRKWAARRAFQVAYILQSAGELERAADAYERSLRLVPTAEANTFLGWTYSFMGRYDEAIAACRRAIEVDPAFGNPYNDIGAYLIELGRLDEAIPWLERAVASPRYCCYFYAHTNLARVYMHKRMPEKARKALHAALRVNPDYAPARELLRHLDTGNDYFG
jgi:protein-L-isoaspartate O-methyltransferase